MSNIDKGLEEKLKKLSEFVNAIDNINTEELDNLKGTITDVIAGERCEFFTPPYQYGKEDDQLLKIGYSVKMNDTEIEDKYTYYTFSTHPKSNLYKFIRKYGYPTTDLEIDVGFDKLNNRWYINLE